MPVAPFTRLEAIARVLPDSDIDTDIIFPARYLVITAKAGLGRYAFSDHAPLRGPDPGTLPERGPAALQGAQILLAGANFGCGSSREQAVWALTDLGVRCLIAPSFGEIFSANCFKNGLLPIALSEARVLELMEDARLGARICVDLEAQRITAADGREICFTVEPWRRQALLTGDDEIDLVLKHQGAAISAFEARQRARAPWMGAGD